VNIDFVARSHCAVEVIKIEDMEVSAMFSPTDVAPHLKHFIFK
jgi:hypothetical protein